MPRHLLSAVSLLVWSACGAWTAPMDPPKLRLPEGVRPVKYSADLLLLPDSPTFRGSVDIEIDLQKPSSLIWLNAWDIRIEDASIETRSGKQPATVEPGNENFVALSFPTEAPAGKNKLNIRYSGKISQSASRGIFQQRDDHELYLFTQFEPIDARRAFPCFDEPGFKTPWQLTLHVRTGHKAFANTPQVSETVEPGDMKRIVFAMTKPLPSYLVAFAVGPFDIVDAGKTGKNQVPVRIITPKGKAYQAKYAAEVTATIAGRLENYFGIPYPFEKIDSISIPFIGFAMENAGLVTYGQTMILSDPATDTEQRQRRYVKTAAHELAHQWFGDLVTLAWWDDIWLNEAFATWASSKFLAEWRPDWNTRLEDLNGRFDAMTKDGLGATGKIRQRVEPDEDISNFFDYGIVYQKAPAVIRMFEVWAGEKQFRARVTWYLKHYSYKNARSDDFLNAIDATGSPGLPGAFKTFLDQPGVPRVSVDLKCGGAPSVVLDQKRYLPIGSQTSAEQSWQIPVCVRYRTANGIGKECFLLDKPNAEFKLTKASSCPASLTANDSAAGYYISAYQGGLLETLIARNSDFMNSAEQLTLLNDMASLVNSGDLKPGRALDAAAAYASSPERLIVAQAVRMVDAQRRFVPAGLLEKYARFVRKVFGERAKALGWVSKPGESQEMSLLRPILVPFVAPYAPPLAAEARRLANAWLADRKGVESDMLSSVLKTAAYNGDRALFDAMLAALQNTSDGRQRGYLREALRSFRVPKLVAATLDLSIHSGLDASENIGLAYAGAALPETQRIPFEFVKANYDEIVKRAQSAGRSEFGAQLPSIAAGFCDADSEKEFIDFFEERAKKFTGGPRNYNQAREAIRFCEAQKSAQGAAVAAFFAKQ